MIVDVKEEPAPYAGHSYTVEQRRRQFRMGQVYEHYKGHRYTALMIACIHDTREPCCVYVSHDTQEPSVRPVKDFFDDVDIGNGERVPRFRLIDAVKR